LYSKENNAVKKKQTTTTNQKKPTRSCLYEHQIVLKGKLQILNFEKGEYNLIVSKNINSLHEVNLAEQF
jgi:hypothetical protein